MSETSTLAPPRAFALAQAVLFIGAALALWLAPASWHAHTWAASLLIGLLGLQWAIWPQSNPAFHPFGVRIFGFLCLAVAVLPFIKFVSE